MTCIIGINLIGLIYYSAFLTFTEVSIRNLSFDSKESKDSKGSRLFLFSAMAESLAVPKQGKVNVSPLARYPAKTLTIQNDMLLNDARPSKDLTTDISLNLYIRIPKLMQMVSESIPWGRGRLALLTSLPAVSFHCKTKL